VIGSCLAALAALAGCSAIPGGSPVQSATDARLGATDAHDAAAALDAFVFPDGSPFDAPPGVPDLQFVAGEMTDSWLVNLVNFPADDCAVVEGCVGAPGDRLLLRFDTVTANLGTGDLVVGVPPPPGESNDIFQWSECHMHHHYANYISYELTNETGVVITGRKQSFCLEDSERVVVGSVPTVYTCDNQGISRGWADVYSRYLACQWIDVTGVPSGTYTLHATVNPAHALVESNYDNNDFSVVVAF
jgi:hypothetical protein